MSSNFWQIYVIYAVYLLVIFAIARIIVWILARAFRVKEKLKLLEEQNELLRGIKEKLGKGESL